MERFDPNKAQEYISRNDFEGLAAYYRQYSFGDDIIQRQVDMYVDDLERYGAIATSILNDYANDPDKEKVAFALQRPYNAYGDEDSQSEYSKTYFKNINSIGNVDDKEAEYIDYRFDTTDKYNQFLDASGLKFGYIDSNNPTKPYKYNDNGTTVIRVYKSAFADSRFFDSLTTGLSSIHTKIPKYMVNQFGYTADISPIDYGYSSVSYDVDGNKIKDLRGMNTSQLIAYDMAQSANKKFEDVMTTKYNKVIASELTDMGFMCNAQRKLTIALENGQIDETTGTKKLNRLNDFYNNHLKTFSATSYDIFATELNGETQNLQQITDSKEKSKITDLIRTAAKNGRLTCTAGAAGARVGTILTISGEPDKDGEKIGGLKGSMQIFVPDLFQEDARKAMKHDINAKILVEKNEHIAFGHQYNLVLGGRFEYFDNNGAYYTNDLGSIPISSEELDNVMLENELLLESIKGLRSFSRKHNATDTEAKADLYARNVYKYLFNIKNEEDLNNQETQAKINTYKQAMLSNIVVHNK